MGLFEQFAVMPGGKGTDIVHSQTAYRCQILLRVVPPVKNQGMFVRVKFECSQACVDFFLKQLQRLSNRSGFPGKFGERAESYPPG